MPKPGQAVRVGAPVVDQTGLTGGYRFTLPEPGKDPNAASLFTILQEELGLRLESQKIMVDTIVIDHAERPTPN
jgi:uncharacterized protein (TIGR03435 family)